MVRMQADDGDGNEARPAGLDGLRLAVARMEAPDDGAERAGGGE